MPTTPSLPETLLAKIRSRRQAVRWKTLLLEKRTFSSFCCNINSSGIMGVQKEPVIIARVTPRPVCKDDDITVDISASYAPGSTISSWSIDMGDSSPDYTGTTPGSITHQYDTVGTYEIEIQVTEGLGKSQEAIYEVDVIDCPEGPDTITGAYTYISTDGYGTWFIDWTESNPYWVDRSEQYRAGESSLPMFIRKLVIDPSTKHLPDENHKLWYVARDGVYRSTDGGRSWAKLTLPEPSNDELELVSPATLDDLDWIDIVFHPTDKNTVFVCAIWNAGWNTWIYKTTDYGTNWENRGITKKE